MLVAEAVAKIQAEGGADSSSSATSAATIRGWINECVADAIGRSTWRRVTRELGPTVAGQAQYAIDDDIVDVMRLRVGTGSPALRISGEDLWEIQGGTRYLVGVAQAFAPAFEDDADSTLELYPAPTTDGDVISAVVAAVPATLEDADTIPLPADIVNRVAVDGPIGILYLRVEEQPASAQPFTDRFEAAVQELSRRANSRTSSGRSQAKIWRVHF